MEAKAGRLTLHGSDGVQEGEEEQEQQEGERFVRHRRRRRRNAGMSGGGGGGAASASGGGSMGFHRRGQEWFYTTGLPSDVIVEVEDVTFHLHKFPLLSRSAKLARLVAEEERMEEEEDEEGGQGQGQGQGRRKCVVVLEGMPGGAEAFELCAKFCYGVRIEVTAGNVMAVRCAAEWLEMGEEMGEGNLIGKAGAFLEGQVLKSWKECLQALRSCRALLPQAHELGLVSACVQALATLALSPSSIPTSPGGSLLWNGISTGARSRKEGGRDWWCAEVATLPLPFLDLLVRHLQQKGVSPPSLAKALVHYAKQYLPALHKRRDAAAVPVAATPADVSEQEQEEEQRVVLETVERLLPAVKGVTSTRLLFGMLRSAMILSASPLCKSSLERRIGMQLEQASLDDLLLPNYSYSVETLYDMDTVQRILDHFLLLDHGPPGDAGAGAGAGGGGADEEQQVRVVASPSLSPVFVVAKLVDAYLAEVAPDVNLKASKFQAMAEALPDYARLMDDGLYRAVDIYLKAHPWLLEHERERVCRVMDCQKLSLEACTHAAQNERLPLRVVVQVLFFEQLQLRTAIAGCFHAPARVPGGSGPVVERGEGEGEGEGGAVVPWVNVARENHVLKVDMDKMRARVSDLEKECAYMRSEIQKLGSSSRSKRRGFKSFDITKLGCSRQQDWSQDGVGMGMQPPGTSSLS